MDALQDNIHAALADTTASVRVLTGALPPPAFLIRPRARAVHCLVGWLP
jgi:hypothetical protein